MYAGDVIADRFDIVRLAGEGGMGRVYQARDRFSGATVALKVLRDRADAGAARFTREAQVLAGLRHPGVVRYVAHGETGEGRAYLVMEWIEGETLSERLRGSGLGVPESVSLAKQIAGALGAVHRAGVVHRDLKPSNVFLAERSVEHALLIDFGVARTSDGVRLTSTGMLVGTPGYMSPEQVRGEAAIDPRADVFSLGCVLFKCLTGRDAFAGDDHVAVAFKVMLDEPPAVSALRPGTPPELDELVARFMSKDRDGRPRDGEAALAALSTLDAEPLAARRSQRPSAIGVREITTNERKLVSLVMVRDPLDHALTRDDRGAEPEGRRRMRALSTAAERHRGSLEVLADEARLVIFTGAGAPTDLAIRAARCALSIRSALSGASISVAMGRAELETRVPVGELIDRAVRLLVPDGEHGDKAVIHVDQITAGLLGARFDMRQAPPRPPGVERIALLGEHDAEPARLLLGKPTSCVGRERELSILDAAFAHAIDYDAACAVLLLGAAGVGKSRLREELMRRLRERGEPFEEWTGHGDPMSAGAAFGLLARALRQAIGLSGGEPMEAQRHVIQLRVEGLAEADRIAAFLGELVGAPFPDEASAQLRAARRDPVLMGDQMRRAAEDLLRAACAEHPVVLVFEDLQWGDLPTVTFIDAALRNLAEAPLLVLALARPEVNATFPGLWAEREVQVVQVGALPPRAAERLVKHALGEAIGPDRVKALVERADGNAFYLEELIRAVATGRDGDLPETVLTMAQARLEALDPEVRRVLRAASVFGRSFSRAGVEALVGDTPVGRRLDELVEREVIVRRDAEFGFRHALVREAAYAMLTERDRARGHALAGEWLESEGKGEAVAVAEHFERGGEPDRAAVFYLCAAEQALEGNDLAAAIEHAERAAACGEDAGVRGDARLIEAEARLWRGELARAEERASEALALLDVGSAAWFRAATIASTAQEKRGSIDRAEELIASVRNTTPLEGAEGAHVLCLCSGIALFTLAGRYAAADEMLEQCLAATRRLGEIDAPALGRFHEAHAIRALTAGDPGACLGHFQEALKALEQAGDRRNACATRTNIAFLFTELGDFAQAEAALRLVLADVDRMGLHELRPGVLQNLALALACVGRLDEARQIQEQALKAFHQQGQVRRAGSSHMYLAHVVLLAGDAAAAEREARDAIDLLVVAPPLRAAAFAVFSRALLRQGRVAEALTAAEEAFALLEAAGGTLEEGESLVRLVHAESLAAAGRADDAARAIAEARDRLLARASRISDPAWRERFLTQVPENAATLAAAGR